MWLGVVVFVVSAIVLLGSVGSYLAMHPFVGGWRGVMPAMSMNVTNTRTTWTELIRTPEGARFRGSTPPAPETVLGTVGSSVSRAEVGWPRTVKYVWTVALNSVDSATGPPASDERAWRVLVAEAYQGSGIPIYASMPAALARGEAHGVEWDAAAFLLNVRDRLWHAPLVSGACVGAAAVLGAGAGLVAWWRRKNPGACGKCGYDLAGLGGGVCPECGTADGTPAR